VGKVELTEGMPQSCKLVSCFIYSSPYHGFSVLECTDILNTYERENSMNIFWNILLLWNNFKTIFIKSILLTIYIYIYLPHFTVYPKFVIQIIYFPHLWAGKGKTTILFSSLYGKHWYDNNIHSYFLYIRIADIWNITCSVHIFQSTGSV
jgi:hypothetical protein